MESSFRIYRPTSLLVPFAVLVGLGILFFTYGFFLTKEPVANESEINFMDNSTKWFEPQVSKLLIIVVDALKFEFLLPDENKEGAYYKNNFPFLQNLLKNEPNSSVLIKFYSDPPTVTQARIKSVLIGNLPPFIDLTKNFGTYTIYEDNFVRQLLKHNRKVFQTGDFIWEYLLGRQFTEIRPYESLDVTDTDTLDTAVIKDLFEFIERDDWNVIIGHCIGMDHVGHAFEMNHREMRRKMKEYNDFIEKLFQKIDNDTLVIIHGDHGMTMEGDHGGYTDLEINTGGFAYIRSGFHPYRQKYREFMDYYPNSNKNVSLINLASTISVIMGVPIPFSNIGRIMPDLYTNKAFENASEIDFLFRILKDYLINAHQVQNYIEVSHVNHSRYKELDYMNLRWEMQNITRNFTWLEHKQRQIGSKMTSEELKNCAVALILQIRDYLEKVYELTRVLMSLDYFMMWTGIILMALTGIIAIVLILYIDIVASLGTTITFTKPLTLTRLPTIFLKPLFRIEILFLVIITSAFMLALQVQPIHFFAVASIFAATVFLVGLVNKWISARNYLRERARSNQTPWRNWIALEYYYNSLLKQPAATLAVIILIGYHAGVMLSVAMLRKESIHTGVALSVSFFLIALLHKNPNTNTTLLKRMTAAGIATIFIAIANHISDLNIREIKDFFLITTVSEMNVIHSIVGWYPIKFILPLVLHPFVRILDPRSNNFLRDKIYVFLYVIGYSFVVAYFALKCYFSMETANLVQIIIPRIIYSIALSMVLYCFFVKRVVISPENKIFLIWEITELPLFLIMGEKNLLNMLILKLVYKIFLRLMKETGTEEHPCSGVLLANLGAFFYFATGHGNQTSTLQMDKGFIGVEKNSIYISFILILFNTLYTHICSIFCFMILFVQPSATEYFGGAYPQEGRQYRKLRSSLSYSIHFLGSILFTAINCLYNHGSLLLLYDFAPKYLMEVMIVPTLCIMILCFYILF